MPQLLETHRDNFTINTDPSQLDVDTITDMLSRAYWAQGRTREMIARRIVAENGEISEQRLKWEVALRLYGADSTTRGMIERKLADVPH